MDRRDYRGLLAVGLTALLACVVVAAAPFLGPAGLDYNRVLAGQSPDYEILIELRLSRTILAALAGAALSLAGVLFQALLRDALATPYSLGVSTAAALGAVAAICFGWGNVAGLPATWAGALVSASVVLWLILALASRAGHLSSASLLLTGITLNSLCSALILLLHSFASFSQSFNIMRWLMGSVDAVSYQQLGWLAVAVLLPSAAVLRRGRDWNAMAFGDLWAAGRGVSPREMLRLGYVAGSILAASVTSVTGPIGFVGLIVPHMLRQLVGSDHRVLLPCSLLAGAAFLVLCDTLARTVIAPAELPVGVVTALIGAPVFIWILQHRIRDRV